jgi:maleylacetoacetate isomerase/maleylpyruvate isomerase
VIACDIHPVNNLRILNALGELGADRPAQAAWARRWIADGLAALEPVVARHGRGWAIGDQPHPRRLLPDPPALQRPPLRNRPDPLPRHLAAEATALTHPAFQPPTPDQHPE